MEIKILGMGCPKCKVLYNNVCSAVRELGIECTVTKVENFDDISNYNVMTTPALVINDVVVKTGKIKYKEVLEILKNA